MFDIPMWLALHGELIDAISHGQIPRSISLQIAYIEPFMIADERGQLFLDKWASIIAEKCDIPDETPLVRSILELCLKEISTNGGVIL